MGRLIDRAVNGAATDLLDSPRGSEEIFMIGEKFFDDVSARIAAAMASSPVRDVEKNVRVALRSALGKLDLVSREEFDLQVALLARTREKLDAMEERLASLEGREKTKN